VTPDVNTIPTDLIERVDVVTGGNSAVYGSDAIAGVVNFILKDDYEGLQLRGQGGVSKYGDAGAYFISGLWGTNFADGRGNVAVNAEYARQDQYFGSGRPFIASQDGFLIVDSDPATQTSDGIPGPPLLPRHPLGQPDQYRRRPLWRHHRGKQLRHRSLGGLYPACSSSSRTER
jgi:outer membrane receptor protein involved in Fe transport